MNNYSIDKQTNSLNLSRFQKLILATTISMFLTILFGSIVRVTGSGLTCQDWPTCFGLLVPPEGIGAATNYIHRIITFVASLLLLLSILEARRTYPGIKLIQRPLYVALVFLVLEIILGGLVILLPAPAIVGAVHLAFGLIILSLVLIPAVAAFVLKDDPSQVHRFNLQSSFGRLTVWVIASIFVVFTSGTLLSSMASEYKCAGWPLCNGTLIPADMVGWLYLAHWILVLFSGFAVVVLFTQAWRSQRSQPAILSATTLVAGFYFAQILVGMFMAVGDKSVHLLGLHATTVSALWSVMVVLFTLVGLAARTTEEELNEASQPVDKRQRARDLLMLTKPIIVALLLVTTYTGMVVGGKQIPSFSVTFWTMLGGMLAAGGSGAVNQYIDRELDKRMTRTAKRPIASGRMTPAEGLAFGLGLLLAAFYLLATFVNLLAAMLSMVGMIYYIVLYSLLLKNSSEQNIVIGGGAGAIPPLVGWAAATGTLDISAGFLFAIIFMWTPPHFWSLAIVRAKEYKAAGVPMMPVVRGKRETRIQIFIYTLELVALTLLMPLLNLAGSVFLISAIVLGGGLIHTAWQVLRVGGNKIAWRMYRWSSMYLMFLFMALLVDALL